MLRDGTNPSSRRTAMIVAGVVGWMLSGAVIARAGAPAASAIPADKPADAKVEPVLPVDEEAVAKIKALKPNQGLLVGKAKVIGDFNATTAKWNLEKTGPNGRDFSIKMCWAPDRGRVLFCGANHGVPHRLNDVWEFDLGAMTWAMLYAPDLPRDYTGLGKDHSDVEFKDGLLITKRGGPASVGHTWWGLAYDPQGRELLFMSAWVTEKKKAVELLGGDPEKLYKGPPLWAFSTVTKQWRPIKSEKPHPVIHFGGLLEWVPEIKAPVWHINNWQGTGTWKLDPATGAWTDLKSNNGDRKSFEAESPQPEQVGYHDPARGLVVVQRHKDTHHFDLKANAWKKVISADKDATDVPHGHDAYAPMYLDTVNGRGLLLEYKTDALWSYDPGAVKWTKLSPEGDPMPKGGKRLMYFDQKHGVLVVIDKTTVWAYRPAGK